MRPTELNSYIAPLYDSIKISLCICIYFIQCHSYFYTYICSIIVLRNTSLSFLYELSLSVCFMYVYLTFVMLHIYSSMYWKSGTSDLLVLMLFVLQYTIFKWNFLTLTLTFTNSLWPSDAIKWQKAGSAMAKVVVYCLTAPSRYLNQCSLITDGVL